MLGRISIAVVLITLVGVMRGEASEQCRVPSYQTARDYVGREGEVGVVHISVRKEDFTLVNLSCLAKTLKHDHATWKDVIVLVFTSHDAALNFRPSTMGKPAVVAESYKELHATFTLNAAKHEEYIELMPLGYDRGSAYNTKVDLAVATPAPCRFSLGDRCLLAFQAFDYPRAALTAGVFGSVIVTGHIGRDGKVSKVRAVRGNATSDINTDILAAQSISQLQSWWFEPAARESDVRLTYEYVIDASLPQGKIEVELSLPGRVVIRAHS